MSEVASSFDLESKDGEIDLSERGERCGDGPYRTTYLVDRQGRLSFRAFWQVEDSHGNPHDEPGVALQLSAYHVENEETGRVFHSHMTCLFSRSEVRVLRSWLGFMLKHWGEMEK